MDLNQICFPVFRLGTTKPNEVGGIVFYASTRLKDGIDEQKIQIVDDRNILEDTLAKRRLKLDCVGTSLFKLSHALFFIADLLKLSSPKSWFIDSSGKVFNYVKSATVKLQFKKITEVIALVSATLVEVEGLPGRYKCLFPPSRYEKYAGFLKLAPHSYILYGFFTEKFPDTTRRI